jgi:hypothetical protein
MYLPAGLFLLGFSTLIVLLWCFRGFHKASNEELIHNGLFSMLSLIRNLTNPSPITRSSGPLLPVMR